MEAESWFTGHKRPLLAPFGVGTVDQSLMAVLQTRHWFVRLFGLAGKVVVFDEVHAYDVYMSHLFERLLRWLSELDCTVIVLSATLPYARRQALVNAYLGRAENDAVPSARYPRLTVARRQHEDEEADVTSIEIPVNEERRTVVDIEWADASLGTITRRVREGLEKGGCIAVVCSTVARAQQVFKQLRKDNELQRLVPDKRHWHLLHARLPFAWRQEAEKRFLKQFGKEAAQSGIRPARAIAVGTAVLEQSLDYDVDLMLSDPAPVDLWLQRMGRVHRFHIAGRTLAPRFVILCDEPDGRPDFGDARHIYAPYVLLRSWLALKTKRTSVALPYDIEGLVESVYGDEPLEVPEDLTDDMNSALGDIDQKRRSDAKAAKDVLVPRPAEPEDLFEDFNRQLDDGEDPRAHTTLKAATRLGRPSVQVVCLIQTDAGIAPAAAPDSAMDLSAEPRRETVISLLKSALPIRHGGIFNALTDEDPPAGWKKDPHLRFHRPLVFENGRHTIAGLDLELDRTLGLLIPQGDQEDIV